VYDINGIAIMPTSIMIFRIKESLVNSLFLLASHNCVATYPKGAMTPKNRIPTVIL
jgi:hypothetical protein